jgi:hypothetical protein
LWSDNMAINKLVYNGVTYDAEIAVGSGLDMDHAMVGETLTVDALTVRIITNDLPDRFIAADQDENEFIYTADDYVLCTKGGASPPVPVPSGAGLYYYNDILVGKYYLYKSHQVGRYEWEMTFYSAIHLLGRSKHFGGIYAGETVATLLADIMGDVSYTVDGDMAAIQVYGYLPYDSRRRNLQKLLMAIGGAVRNNADDSLRVTSLSDSVVGTIDESRVFVGAEVIDENPCTAVQVTEHNFIEASDTETLYENATVSTETITFSAPHHDYSITNGTIIESGVNYVKFVGAGFVTITGKRYIHVERILTIGDEPTGADTDNVKVVSDNTLLSPNNAYDVAQSLYDFLSVAQSIRADVVFGSERTGDVVNVVNPYTREIVKCCTKSMEIDFGVTELRARSKFLVGYTPPSLISGFENHVLLTGTGQWIVPAGVTKIRAILAEAGDGAAGGSGGNGGKQVGSAGVGGNEGGVGGEPGSGGRIFEINIVVTPGQIINFACGVGGLGGSAGAGGARYSTGTPGGKGTDGGDTTFGAYAASLGRRYPDGYTEPKTGLILGATGARGVDGGRGSDVEPNPAESVTFDGVTYTGGADGADVPGNYPGNVGTAIGGGAGGAAVGQNGANGTDGKWEWSSRSGVYGTFTGYWAMHGRGGDGASATINGANASGYGCGGSGGHGGGGGGHAVGDIPNVFDLPGTPGLGGDGSDGGNGGDGCIVIYY